MLRERTILHAGGLEVRAVACRHGLGRGTAEVHDGRHAVVLVRRGTFVRVSDGGASTLDPTLAYCLRPGAEHRYDHVDGAKDDCTTFLLDVELLAGIWGGDPTLPTRPIPTSPSLDLAHRTLLATPPLAGAAAEPDERHERAVELIARLLEQADRVRVASGRPATAAARKALVDGVREALTVAPDRSLTELARLLSVSPHHLSRVFRADTRMTVARFRMRLRTRAALERMAGGERDLSRLAADVGFVDQSHLSRVLRSELGETPAVLRDRLDRGVHTRRTVVRSACRAD